MNGETVKIVANGAVSQIRLPCCVGEFLGRCGWRPTQVVVEHNGRVLSRGEVESVPLADGDRIEVILPVAGG